MNIAILGGYGIMGQQLARVWLTGTDGSVLLLGRRADALYQCMENFRSDFKKERVKGEPVDARDPSAVADACRKNHADWLIFALDSAKLLEPCIEAALLARTHCLDLTITPGKDFIWQSRRSAFQAAGLIAITEAGLQPGLPGVLLRAAIQAQPTAQTIVLSTFLKIKIPPDLPMPASMVDLMDSFRQTPALYRHGQRRVDWWALLFPYRWQRLTPPFGLCTLSTVALPEIEIIARRHPQIAQIRYQVGGFNLLANWLAIPLMVPFLWIGGRYIQRLLAKILYYGVLRPFTKPPFGVAMQVIAIEGGKKRWSLDLWHKEEYGFTAEILQKLLVCVDRNPPLPGVHLMADVLEPLDFVRDWQVINQCS
ncbi:MAG: hypothetical protein KDK39_12130 [Leptospiraceae bacterium]|nr:hypothetical protein [Leptospiraceae bacterium]